MGKLLNLDNIFARAQPVTLTAEEGDKQDEEEEQEFEFRLFSTSTQKRDARRDESGTAGKPAQGDTKSVKADTKKLRIRIRSPTPGPVDPSEGRLVRPFRGWEYYFTTPELLSSSQPTETRYDTDKRSQFEDVAVSGTEMMEWAKEVWVGIASSFVIYRNFASC